MDDLVIDLSAGDRPPRRSRDLTLRASAREVVGLDLSGLRCSHLSIDDGFTMTDVFLPAFVRRRRARTTFRDCRFDGLRVTARFDPGETRFVNCSFRNTRVSGALIGADFVGCVFEGEWNLNLSARDERRPVTIEGNDFRGVTGLTFYDGVPAGKNVFDHGGTQVVLHRGGPGWVEARRIAQHDPNLAILLDSLEGRGPIGLNQSWALLYEGDFAAADWAALVREAGSTRAERPAQGR